jgi:hypothetical protein
MYFLGIHDAFLNNLFLVINKSCNKATINITAITETPEPKEAIWFQ